MNFSLKVWLRIVTMLLLPIVCADMMVSRISVHRQPTNRVPVSIVFPLLNLHTLNKN